MRRSLAFLILFACGNILGGLGHIQVFQSAIPHAVWGSLAVHAAILLFFPYQKLFSK